MLHSRSHARESRYAPAGAAASSAQPGGRMACSCCSSALLITAGTDARWLATLCITASTCAEAILDGCQLLGCAWDKRDLLLVYSNAGCCWRPALPGTSGASYNLDAVHSQHVFQGVTQLCAYLLLQRQQLLIHLWQRQPLGLQALRAAKTTEQCVVE